MTLDRRHFLSSTLAAAGAMAVAGCTSTEALQLAQGSQVSVEKLMLEVHNGRATELTVWAPAAPRAVALFSTGMGSWPERYARVIDLLTAEGFAVVAPLHVDSQRSPDLANFTLEQGLIERVADLQASAQYVRQHFAGLPLIAAGHSYGSLLSLGEGGAFAGMIPMRVPEVRAVLAFSSPARIPGLVGDDVYASVEVPLMMVTGTLDTIPAVMGYPNVAEDHLLPVQTSTKQAYGIVVEGADHLLADDAALLARAVPAVRLFLRAYGLGDAGARNQLNGWQAASGDRFIMRGTGND